MSETNDRWAAPLILASTLNVNSVSCASSGYCAAGGLSSAYGAFVMSEWHGTWGKAVRPAGIPARYGATVTAVACPPRVTLCIAGGYQTPPTATTPSHSSSARRDNGPHDHTSGVAAGLAA